MCSLGFFLLSAACILKGTKEASKPEIPKHMGKRHGEILRAVLAITAYNGTMKKKYADKYLGLVLDRC